MSAMEEGTKRLRAIIGDDPNITEKKMFGGVAFMLNGNMLCGYTHKGQLMIRVGKKLEPEARKPPGARDMDLPVKRWAACCLSTKTPAQRVALATRFVGGLPAK